MTARDAAESVPAAASVRAAPDGGRDVRAAAAAPSGRLAASALAAVQDWLLEPAEAAPADADDPAAPPRPVVAVFGLEPGCGVTVVARALAVELGRRDAAGAAAVHCHDGAGGVRLASAAAGRLARLLVEVPGAVTRTVGRLCLVEGADGPALADTARHLAPLVIDAGREPVGGAPAAVADSVVLVAGRNTEPALAAVAAQCVARVAAEPLVVRSRGAVEDGWLARAALALPESRPGAQLALAGREPRGELGRAVSELADLCERRR